MKLIDVKGLKPGAVLAALYNRAVPARMGFLAFDPKPMTAEEGEALLAEQAKYRSAYFDYVNGRRMKVEIKGDEIDVERYEQNSGLGAATEAIEHLRATGEVTGKPDKKALTIAINEARVSMATKTETKIEPGKVPTVVLGLSGVPGLKPALDKAEEQA